MSFKTLLAPHPVDEPPARLDTVVAMADALGAHIDALVLNAVSPMSAMTFVRSPDLVRDEFFMAELKRTDACAAEVREYLAERGVGADITAESQPPGLIGDTVAKSALYTDLVVVDGARSSLVSGSMGHVVEGALFAAGKPVLVLGDTTTPWAPGEAMIAWDGSRGAARAVQQSLPLLKGASFVRACTIDEGDESEIEASLRSLCAWLARHGVDAATEHVAPAGRFVHHALVEQVTRRRPDLLVMGAYGHTRLRERLFSGATRAALSDLETPLFLAH